MDAILINVLLVMMVVTVVAIVRSRNLFAVVVLGSIYSFLMATAMVAMDAVDVAMTEAAVGAGLSTVLMLGALLLCRSEESRPSHRPWLPLGLSLAVGGLVVYGTYDLADFADPQAPIHQHVVPRYLEQMPQEIDIPNVVTAVLGSYRAFDTLGEVLVVFTAGVAVFALLRKRKARS